MYFSRIALAAPEVSGAAALAAMLTDPTFKAGVQEEIEQLEKELSKRKAKEQATADADSPGGTATS